jgi:hypothetical protein
MRKKYYYAKNIRNYIKKNSKMAKQQLVMIRPAYINNFRRLVYEPVHAAGFMFMKLCKFSADGAGFVMGKVER